MNIKKLTLSAAMLALGVTSVMAVPARQGLRTATQPDGSTLQLRLIGDEYFHSYVTTDGLTVGRGADGAFYYKSTAGLSGVVAHNPAERTASETAWLSGNSSSLGVKSLVKAKQSEIKARRAARRVATNPKRASQVPNIGSARVPIILVQYKDYKFKDADANATFTNFFESGEVSARQYFIDQSNGKYTPQFDVYGPYTLSGNRTAYGANGSDGFDVGMGKMVAEGCQAGNPEIDFSKYDNDGDGECDVVIVLYAGDGEASSYEEDAEDAVWPCQWALSSSDYGKDITLDNTKISRFAVFNELNGKDLSKIDGIGTFCHEFSHCLGLPDFYDTEYGPHFGMSNWSLMDYGSYNDDGYTPIGYSAYEKEFMGWIEIEEGSEDTFYTLPIFNQKQLATDKAVKLTNPKDKNEYFILENRAKQGWDKFMPTEGLLITHFTYSDYAWEQNVVNNYDMQRATVVPSDGTLKVDEMEYYGETVYVVDEDDLLGDLWPYNGNNAFTDESTPAAKVNTGSFLSKPITEIERNADGTISFWCMQAPKPAVATPTSISHEEHSKTSATISWVGDDVNDVTYTLELKPHRDITYELISKTIFNTDDHGWETDGYASISNDLKEGSVRLGSSKQVGYLTSPKFNALDGDDNVTVKVIARNYEKDQSSISVALLDKNMREISSKEFSLSSSYAEYTALLSGAKDVCYVEIGTVESKKRAYVKSAEIYVGDATEAQYSSALKAAAVEAPITFTGLTATSHKVEGLTEDQAYDVRVKAVPVNADDFASSAWSETYLLELNGSTLVTDIEAAEAEAEYFTLQGIRIQGRPSAAGIYIERCGTQIRKVIISE